LMDQVMRLLDRLSAGSVAGAEGRSGKRKSCPRGTTPGPRFVTGDQWKNGPCGLRSADNE
jgi:hypothetical protein